MASALCGCGPPQKVCLKFDNIGRSHPPASQVLVKRGFRVFGGVRTEKDAERLRTDFGPSVLPVIMDITDQASVSEAAKQVHIPNPWIATAVWTGLPVQVLQACWRCTTCGPCIGQPECTWCQVRRALKGHTLQGLVNNAGVMSPLAPLMLQSLAEFQVVMDTNVTGTLRVTQVRLSK